jgi:hypothetical protein
MSSNHVEGRTRTGEAAAALAEFLRVKFNGTQYALAGASDADDGTVEVPAAAQGDIFTVLLRNAEGTTPMIASEAITAGNLCYAAASGKVAASGSVLVGRALEAATANGDVIEVQRIGEASNAAAAGGTTAAAFLVDSDATTPKIELAAQTAGTGDFKLSVKPAATLTGNRTATFQNDADANIKTDHTFAATPNSSAGSGNSIPVGCRQVAVGAPANDANDFIVLPAIANVSIGDQIVIACNGGSNFELRTPASSNTKINDVDSDGTQEYLCTDTDVVIVTKATTTGWVAQSITKLGAVRTAVVPD